MYNVATFVQLSDSVVGCLRTKYNLQLIANYMGSHKGLFSGGHVAL